MRIPTHLRLSRHGVYYFRIVVPKAVRPAFGGRPEIKASLGTRNIKVALVEARRFAIEAYDSFAKVQALMSVKKRFDPDDRSTWPTAGDPLGKYESTIETPTPFGIQRFHVKADPNFPDDVAAAKEATKDYIAKMEADRQALATPSVEEAAKAEAFRAAHRAAVEEAVAAAMVKRPVPEPIESALSANSVAPAKPPRPRVESDRRLSALWPRYLNHKKKTSLKTARAEKSYQAKFEMFIEWNGDSHIEDVLPEDISRYKDFLLTEYQPTAGKNQGKVGVEAPTVDNYLGPLNGLYKWARTNGYFPRQMLTPTDSQSMMTKRAKKARAQSGKANRAFKIEELVTAFDAATYRAENTLAHHFWPPLIALFTGMRLGEVSQLACADIFMEEGLWSISINDEDYKRVKSAASRRTIPMHPELVKLGLPQFAHDVTALNLGPQLFPVLRPNSGGELGNAAGKKWDRYLKVAGLTDDALTYHSLRRTANMLLKKKKVPFDVRCQMVGHDLDHVNELYSSEYTVSELAEMILPKFVFEGLDLTGIRYQSGEFNQAIKDGLAAALVEEERRAKQEERKQAKGG